jgi:sulfopyruvate decarboxylase TPP-binding subunit
MLEFENYTVATDEAEAVALACGEYLATGIPAKVVMGENGFLNALDAIITLSQLHELPMELFVFPRDDEPQHKMVADGLENLILNYKIHCHVVK